MALPVRTLAFTVARAWCLRSAEIVEADRLACFNTGLSEIDAYLSAQESSIVQIFEIRLEA